MKKMDKFQTNTREDHIVIQSQDNDQSPCNSSNHDLDISLIAGIKARYGRSRGIRSVSWRLGSLARRSGRGVVSGSRLDVCV